MNDVLAFDLLHNTNLVKKRIAQIFVLLQQFFLNHLYGKLLCTLGQLSLKNLSERAFPEPLANDYYVLINLFLNHLIKDIILSALPTASCLSLNCQKCWVKLKLWALWRYWDWQTNFIKENDRYIKKVKKFPSFHLFLEHCKGSYKVIRNVLRLRRRLDFSKCWSN